MQIKVTNPSALTTKLLTTSGNFNLRSEASKTPSCIRELRDTGAGCSENFRSLLLWRESEPAWMLLCARGLAEGLDCVISRALNVRISVRGLLFSCFQCCFAVRYGCLWREQVSTGNPRCAVLRVIWKLLLPADVPEPPSFPGENHHLHHGASPQGESRWCRKKSLKYSPTAEPEF